MLWSLAVFVGWLVTVANGQGTSNVTCSTGSDWMVNKFNQSSCLVSAHLSAICNNGQWNVPPLTLKGPYNPPSGPGITPCRCSSVVYALISACSLCQGGLIGPFSDWIANCPNPYISRGSFPSPVPDYTEIPNWALVDPNTTGGIWNATLAKQMADSEKNPSSGSNYAPIIAGGVVGGVAGLSIIVFLLWWLYQKRSGKLEKPRTPAPTRQIGHQANASFSVEYSNNNNNYAQLNHGTPIIPNIPTMTPITQFHPMSPPLKPYDPDDPSTYPTTPATSILPSYSGAASVIPQTRRSSNASMTSPPPFNASPPTPSVAPLFTGSSSYPVQPVYTGVSSTPPGAGFPYHHTGSS